LQEQKDVLLTADIGGTNCRFSLWQANIKIDVVYDEIFTKVHERCIKAGEAVVKLLLSALCRVMSADNAVILHAWHLLLMADCSKLSL